MFKLIKHKIIISNLLVLPFIFIALLIVDSERTTLIDLKIHSLYQQAKTIANILTQPSSGRYHVKRGRLKRALGSKKNNFILRQAILGDDVDALLFDIKGNIIEDSRQHLPGKITVMPLDNVGYNASTKSRYQILYERFFRFFYQSNITDHILFEANEGAFGADFVEFKKAIQGEQAAILRMDHHYQTILSVTVPVQRLGKILGVLKLSSSNQEIIMAVRSERKMLIQFFLVAAISSIVISYLLAKGIAKPIGQLTHYMRYTQKSNFRASHLKAVNVSKLRKRSDEIGILAKSFDRLVKTLINRFSEIEYFASDVAHELKNPLTSLKSALDVITFLDQDLKKNYDKKQKLIEIAHHDIKRIDRLIGDISNLSRIDAEMYRAEYEVVNLVALLSDLVHHYQQGALAQKSTITLHCTQQEVLFKAIAERLGSVFSNIIENALSFIPKAGSVDIFLMRQNNQIIIKIIDNGPGFSKGVRHRVFERFYSDRSDKHSFGNHSGLGLAIVKRIVQSHNGSIKAYNRKDMQSGAVFEIIFNPDDDLC